MNQDGKIDLTNLIWIWFDLTFDLDGKIKDIWFELNLTYRNVSHHMQIFGPGPSSVIDLDLEQISSPNLRRPPEAWDWNGCCKGVSENVG